VAMRIAVTTIDRDAPCISLANLEDRGRVGFFTTRCSLLSGVTRTIHTHLNQRGGPADGGRESRKPFGSWGCIYGYVQSGRTCDSPVTGERPLFAGQVAFSGWMGRCHPALKSGPRIGPCTANRFARGHRQLNCRCRPTAPAPKGRNRQGASLPPVRYASLGVHAEVGDRCDCLFTLRRSSRTPTPPTAS
jgi:hypothetical protein